MIFISIGLFLVVTSFLYVAVYNLKHKTPQGNIWFVASRGKSINGKRIRSRTWGFAFTKDDAIQWVLNQPEGMSEYGYYKYVVIESVAPYFDLSERNEVWYELRSTTESKRGPYSAVEIEKPEEFSKTINFTIG